MCFYRKQHVCCDITVFDDLTVSESRAFAGTAFILTLDSILTSEENSHIYFLNNYATNIRGVFYIANNKKYLFSQNAREYHINILLVC